jgi:hypothetical protein
VQLQQPLGGKNDNPFFVSNGSDTRLGHKAPTSESWQTCFKIYEHEAQVDGPVSKAEIVAFLQKPYDELVSTDLPAGLS